MNNLEILKNNLTPDVKFVLNEEKGEYLMLKPMNMAQQAKIAEIAPKLEACKGENGEVQLDAELIKELSVVLASVIERSVEGISKDETDNFVAGHLKELMGVLNELLPQDASKAKTDLIKERMENIKSG